MEKATLDRYGAYGDDVSSPPTRAYTIVPNDADPLPEVIKGIYVGTSGDVRIRSVNAADDVTYKNLTNGSYIGVRAAYVRATGTTATATATDLIGEA